MANVEDLPPRPFVELLGRMGLSTWIKDECGDGPLTFDAEHFRGANVVREHARVG
jgi:hypothetical protein